MTAIIMTLVYIAVVILVPAGLILLCAPPRSRVGRGKDPEL